MNNPAEKFTRPAGIKFLMIGIASNCLYQLYRLLQALSNWETLSILELTISPYLLVGESLVWVLIGGFLVWSVWKAKDWARPLSLVASSIFAIYSWIKQLWIYEPSVLQARWPVNLALTILGLGLFGVILNLKSSRAYFHENESKIT
jgi:hypothetical protein